MNKLRFFIVFFLLPALFCLFPFESSGKDIEKDRDEFVYNSGGKRDPFMPLVDKDGRLVTGFGGRIESKDDVRIEGIVYDPAGDSVVVINGIILKENDVFSNIKVIKIKSREVTLLFNNEEFVFYLEE